MDGRYHARLMGVTHGCSASSITRGAANKTWWRETEDKIDAFVRDMEEHVSQLFRDGGGNRRGRTTKRKAKVPRLSATK